MAPLVFVLGTNSCSQDQAPSRPFVGIAEGERTRSVFKRRSQPKGAVATKGLVELLGAQASLNPGVLMRALCFILDLLISIRPPAFHQVTKWTRQNEATPGSKHSTFARCAGSNTLQLLVPAVMSILVYIHRLNKYVDETHKTLYCVPF